MLNIRRFGVILIIAVLTLVTWIYWSWSSTIERSNTLPIERLRSPENYFVKQYLLEPLNTTCDLDQFLIILVTSYVGHIELRSAHRRAMPSSLLKSKNITRIFLLAGLPTHEKYITQEAIKDESNLFGDILQGSFTENYRNLTYKHVMGLYWTSRVCNKASYILKVDDDIIFNLDKTIQFLLTLNNVDKNNFLMGYVLRNTKPRRMKQNKWYVMWNEYSRNVYPPYLSGWYYITTPKVAFRISKEAIYHPYFWIDDIFVTGILTETLNIKLRQLPQDFWLEYYELLECCLRDMIKLFIKCDHVVGPNGGRNNLLVEFTEAIQNCTNGKCTTRDVNFPLKKVCVSYKEREIFGKGQAEVKFIKL